MKHLLIAFAALAVIVLRLCLLIYTECRKTKEAERKEKENAI